MSFPATYLDFLRSTREVKLTAVDDILNEAMQQKYVLTELLRNKATDTISKGGSKLVDFIRVASNGSFQSYRPGDQLTPVSADTTKKIELAWRFHQCNFGFLEEQRILNDGDPAHFFDMMKKDEGDAVIDFVQGLENKLWAVPSTADMEDQANGKEMYSIPVFVNEYTNGLPTGFSTVMSVDPTSTTIWKNQQAGYSKAAALNNTGASDSILSAMDTCLEQVDFEPIPFGPAKQFQENDQSKDLMLCTSLDGLNIYKKIIRSLNDRTNTASDASIGAAQFGGYRLKRVNALETAAIYLGVGLSDSHSSGVAVSGYPRYYFLNTKYLYPIFNKERFFDKKELINGGINLPNFWTQYYMTMAQLWCGSRKRHGIVYPNAA